MTDEEFKKLEKSCFDECNRRDTIRVKSERVNKIVEGLNILNDDGYMTFNMNITFDSSNYYTSRCDNHCIKIDSDELFARILNLCKDELQKDIDALKGAEVSNEQQ